jgi:hypothetical protein
MATPTRNEMIEWLAVHGSKTGNTTASTVRTYYQHQDESVIQNDFTRELTKQQAAYAGARRNLPETPELKVARESAAAAIQARDAAYADMVWSSICAKPVKHVNPRYNGKTCSPSQACRTEVFSWPHDGERMSAEWFQKIMDEQPFLADRLAWQDYQNPQAEAQQNKENGARTLAIFFNVARRLNISHSQANQASVLAVYPDGILDANQLEQDINAGKISLHAAGAAEAEQFKKELVKAHNLRWQQVTKNMSVAEIKQVSAQERAEREQLTNLITPEQRRPAGIVPLPAVLTKELLLENLSSDRVAIHTWTERYGIQAINARLQGVA